MSESHYTPAEQDEVWANSLATNSPELAEKLMQNMIDAEEVTEVDESN